MSDTPFYVECCNIDCGWEGMSNECVTFKHDPFYLMCPECHEVVEPQEREDTK